MSSKVIDKGGFVSPVPAGTDESDPTPQTTPEDAAATAAADAAALAAAKAKTAQLNREAEEEDDLAPLQTTATAPTITPLPACKNLEHLMASLPPLPKLEDITPETHGSTVGTFAGWLIPGRVLAGEYPGGWEDADHIEQLEGLLTNGVDCIVNLQAEIDHKCPMDKWRTGLPYIRPYLQDVQYMAQAITEGLTAPAGAQNVRADITLLDIRIPEGGTIADDVLSKQLKLLTRHMQRGRLLYIHGWGGHGRNGIVTALLLHQLYGLGHVEALKYAQKIHDMRGSQQVEGVKNKSPANSKQRAQVTRIIKAAAGRNGARRSSVAARVGGPPPAKTVASSSPARQKSVLGSSGGVGGNRRGTGSAGKERTPLGAGARSRSNLGSPRGSPRASPGSKMTKRTTMGGLSNASSRSSTSTTLGGRSKSMMSQRGGLGKGAKVGGRSSASPVLPPISRQEKKDGIKSSLKSSLKSQQLAAAYG